MSKLIIGAHASISKGIPSAFKNILDIGGNAVQFFTGSPRTLKRSRKLTEKEIILCKKLIKENNMFCIIHSAYTINIAKPISENKNAVKSILYELEFISNIINNSGAVVHIGKKLKLSDKKANKNMISFIKKVVKKAPKNAYLILENPAGQGTEMHYCFNSFCDFYNSIPPDIRKKVKVCLDTCHLFAAGEDISNSKKVREFFKCIKNNIGINNVACIHLNDSKVPLGKRVDRHADIGCGYIKKKGLKKFVYYAKKYSIPLILETKQDCKSFKEQINIIKKW